MVWLFGKAWSTALHSIRNQPKLFLFYIILQILFLTILTFIQAPFIQDIVTQSSTFMEEVSAQNVNEAQAIEQVLNQQQVLETEDLLETYGVLLSSALQLITFSVLVLFLFNGILWHGAARIVHRKHLPFVVYLLKFVVVHVLLVVGFLLLGYGLLRTFMQLLLNSLSPATIVPVIGGILLFYFGYIFLGLLPHNTVKKAASRVIKHGSKRFFSLMLSYGIVIVIGGLVFRTLYLGIEANLAFSFIAMALFFIYLMWGKIYITAVMYHLDKE